MLNLPSVCQSCELVYESQEEVRNMSYLSFFSISSLLTHPRTSDFFFSFLRKRTYVWRKSLLVFLPIFSNLTVSSSQERRGTMHANGEGKGKAGNAGWLSCLAFTQCCLQIRTRLTRDKNSSSQPRKFLLYPKNLQVIGSFQHMGK